MLEQWGWMGIVKLKREELELLGFKDCLLNQAAVLDRVYPSFIVGTNCSLNDLSV